MSNEEKLVKMLKYVSEHNDFYKNRIKEYGISNPLDITQWPVLTRKELQENRYNMFSDGYKNKYYNQQLRRQSSSGTTGMPVNVYWDSKDLYSSNMSLWRKRWEWYGIKPRDKYCVFTLNAFGIIPESGKLYYINEPKNVLSFNVSLIQDEQGYKQMVDTINEFRPDWLYIQPFVLNHLINAFKKLGTEPVKTIRYIESVGEILTSDCRRRAEKLFNVRITNMYGSEEMNGIAIESLNGEMRVLTDNVFLEIKNKDGIVQQGKGESIITNLNNFTMPLIRYCQEDCVVLDVFPKDCYCKNHYPVITMHHGRSFTSIILEDHTALNAFALLELISNINNQFNFIVTEYQYVYYRKRNHLMCAIKLLDGRSGWFNAVKEALIGLYIKNIGFKASHMTFEVDHLQERLNGTIKSSILTIME